ncbi:hypothetical protein PR048_019221 [Dryococelus australis]|uniref:HAT C-terminal dimerisation domain-containing protein n=1 Tax=Dryococelus australis TaxID=614101 RepID=A0ABQ9H2W3_9NEOP|nr:hypothetical protein PR048_019221 [Dryococelus australis]
MFGSRIGVAKLFKEKFPSIVWHCASQRLELYNNDAVKEVGGMNRFKSFMDKLYTIYHASPKNARELKLQHSRTVWQNYEAMVLHFEEAKEDRTRNKKDSAMYEGLLRKISSIEFILGLGLMCDSLQELSEVSLDLQERNNDLYKAHLKVKDLVEVFEERKTCPGSTYRKSLEAAENLKFCGVVLHKKGRLDDPPISPSAFYESLKNLIQKRLLCNSDVEMSRCAKVLDFKTWPTGAKENILFGEEVICKLSKRFKLNEREFVKSPDVIPEKLLHLKNTLNIITVSSSECERGFSQMNITVTPDRTALLTETIKNIMFTRIVRLPLTSFDPSRYVKTQLLQGRHSAIDTNSKSRMKDEEENGRMAKIGKVI